MDQAALQYVDKLAVARERLIIEALGLPVYRLPSTSPAHASWSFEPKLEAWRAVFVAHGVR